jgi:hypothetical protein
MWNKRQYGKKSPEIWQFYIHGQLNGNKSKGKGKGHPITSHEGPTGGAEI